MEGSSPNVRRSRRSEAPSNYVVAQISLWGQLVGSVAESRSGRIYFQYDRAFQAKGLEISPLRLPLRDGAITFPELRRLAGFAGLPGVLADSLPDAFGNAVIKRYFEAKGTPSAALSPVQRLLYVGARAMGALEFSPPTDRQSNEGTEQAITVARLVDEARRVIEGDTTVAVPEIMQVGASAGGARAKALILWNQSRNRVKSGFSPLADGDEHWLIKFDGVTAGGTGGPQLREDVRPSPWGRIEYVYSQMARAAGIDMTDTYLLQEREFAHFMTKRFDRVGTKRVHMHSLGGLVHVDYNERGLYSYDQYFTTIRELGMGQADVEQAFRRMVFNIAAVNQDDHVKNFAFLMTENGAWHLSPAYDVMFAHGSQWTRTHQMTVGGKDDLFTREDLLALGRAFDIYDGGASILRDVAAALEAWDAQGRAVDIPAEQREHISSLFRRF
jgi:serine/threonine-protein kinase HipA